MINFKEFSWERYRAGDEVQYRGGGEPLEIVCLTKAKITYPVTSLYASDDGIHLEGHHKKNGAFLINGQEHPLDLVMKPKKKTVWVNVCKYKNLYHIPHSICYESKEEATQCGLSMGKDVTYKGTFPIEIEE